MSLYAVTVDGCNVNNADETTEIVTEDMPDVHVSFPGEEGNDEWRCTLCGERTYDRDDDDNNGRCDQTECEECEGWGSFLADGTPDNKGAADSTECATCEGTGFGSKHNYEADAHMWVNSASVIVNDDAVMVTISVGDPRGAFVMRVENITYTNDEGDEVTELRLSVPTPADTMPHMGLVPLGSPGYYRIVASESPEHVAARNAARS
jgi:hypothetical protein